MSFQPEAEAMPNKTIYVADADLPVFERAQELAGENLSATIVQALRHFVATEDARTQGYDEVRLRVGSQGTYTTQRFLGRKLASQRTRDQALHRIVTLSVFQTAKGRLVLYMRAAPDWNTWAAHWDWDWDVEPERGSRHRQREHGRGGGWSDRNDWNTGGQQDWSTWSEGSEHRMDVYETLDELKPYIDEALYDAVARALRGEDDEFLDI